MRLPELDRCIGLTDIPHTHSPVDGPSQYQSVVMGRPSSCAQPSLLLALHRPGREAGTGLVLHGAAAKSQATLLAPPRWQDSPLPTLCCST